MSELCNIQIFPFDYKKFLAYAINLHKDAVQYKHHGTEVIEGMTTAKFMNREVIDLVCEIGIKGKVSAKFVYIEPNAVVPRHKDWGTKCALMWVLDNNDASIEFDSGIYKYKAALVDVSKEHWVTNTDTWRRLFKISVFDMEYEEVCKNLISRFL